MEEVKKKLTMKFDPRTVEHLGISLYSKLPTVIAELISNSWDADAENINLEFIDEEDKKIIYEDDGEGMSFEELNNKFLLIGRNRRSEDSEITKKGRKVIGKKGLGKLSVFGICKIVEIITIKDGLRNRFEMDIDEIINNTSGFYIPKILDLNVNSNENSGTKIILKKIKRKSNFNIKEIAINLSKKFLIFDKINVNIKHNGKNFLRVTNELK
jgi:HSP90 family molecular chaperone